jgi:hypothetical protein
MGFESSEYTKTYYAGRTTLRVLGVNPTKSQLEEWGFKPQGDPSYINGDKARAAFYFKDTTTNLIYNTAFFVENVDRKSNAGDKTQWINKAGQTWWGADSTPTQAWQSTEGVRAAKKGESDLVDFVKVWLSAYKECQFTPEEIEAISKGDVTVLKAMAIENTTKFVGALVGVQNAGDGKYYNKLGTFCGAKSTPEKFSVGFTKFIDGNPKNTNEYYFGVIPFELTEITEPEKLPFGQASNPQALMQENEL